MWSFLRSSEIFEKQFDEIILTKKKKRFFQQMNEKSLVCETIIEDNRIFEKYLGGKKRKNKENYARISNVGCENWTLKQFLALFASFGFIINSMKDHKEVLQ